MPITQTEACELLKDARAAYHALKTGTMARVVVDQNGERVEFAAANANGLYNYIKELEQLCPGSGANNGQFSRPVRFLF